MKKTVVLIAIVLGTANLNAQDYDLQGLAKACEEYSNDDSFYPTMSSFHDGLAAVSKDGKWGYIDKKGNLAIPLQYDDAKDFSEGRAAVRKGKFYGFIDTDGNFLIQPRLIEAAYFINGFAFANLSTDNLGGWYTTFIDTQAVPLPINLSIIPGGGDESGLGYEFSFSEGLAAVCPEDNNPNGNMGYINSTGRLVIPNKFELAYNFKDGVACVRYNNKYGYIDKNGRTVIPMIYEDFYISHFCNDGLIRVAKKGRVLDAEWGYLDKTGRTVIPCKYSEASDFSEGVAFVEELSSDYSSKWTGFIDTKGNKLIKCDFHFEKGFKNGMCVMSKDGKYSYLNKSFQLIAPFKYDKAEDFSEGLALVMLGDKWGYIDSQGNSTFNPTAIENTSTSPINGGTSLQEKAKAMGTELREYVTLAYKATTKEEGLPYAKKVVAVCEKMLNTAGLEDLTDMEDIKYLRDTFKQIIETSNAEE